MGNNLSLCCAIFGVYPITYKRPHSGLLIASGAGLMMATMDACESFSHCIDFDTHQRDPARLEDWVRAADRNALFTHVGFAGWFSYTSPQTVASMLATLRLPSRWYIGGGIGAECFDQARVVRSLDDLVQWSRGMQREIAAALA